MESPEIINPTPEEAVDWPLRYVKAGTVKAGDYLIRMGEFMKVHAIKTFEPYRPIQVRAGGVIMGLDRDETCWILEKP